MHGRCCTKYRYRILCGRVAERARYLIRQIFEARDVAIVRGAVSPDHVHMPLLVRPALSPAKLAQYIKSRSSRHRQTDTCGRDGTSARQRARWMRQRQGLYREPEVGTKTTRASRITARTEPGASSEPGTLQTASVGIRLSLYACPRESRSYSTTASCNSSSRLCAASRWAFHNRGVTFGGRSWCAISARASSNRRICASVIRYCSSFLIIPTRPIDPLIIRDYSANSDSGPPGLVPGVPPPIFPCPDARLTRAPHIN